MKQSVRLRTSRLTRAGRRHAALVAIAAATLVAGGLAATPVEASGPSTGRSHLGSLNSGNAALAPPVLSWHACFGGDLECTRATVPLDYDDPAGETTSIFMSRLPASDPANRIGSVFINPGGPGGPSSQYVPLFADLLGSDVTARFDVVGIDPRGIGRSRQLKCRSSQPVPRFPRNWVPLNAEQARPLIRYDNYIAAACAEQAGVILDHMTTADTARDMDLIRQSLGDAQLSYYGISYGTYLGATYAALFPGQVRAIVLDGVLDPVSWSTGRPGRENLPFSTRLRSGTGAWDALVSAFAECDRVGKKRCTLAGQSTQKWQRIISRLKQGPARVSGGRIFYSDVIGGALGPLYSRRSYVYLMRQIKLLYHDLFTTPHGETAKVDLVHSFRVLARSQPGPYLSPGATIGPRVTSPSIGTAAKGFPIYASFEGVACSDSLNPDNSAAWVKAGAVADRWSPWFGRIWTWASGSCAHWPVAGDDAFRGPWRVHTSSPVLAIGNFHDPATPISGARRVNALFPGSRLLSLDTWGHGAIGQSACVKLRITRYLVDQRLPIDGLVCQPNKQLFPRRQ